VVISDLHLDPERAEDCAGFIDWIERLEAPRLAVLGDLFDYWVGPYHQGREGSQAVIRALSGLTGRGTRLELLCGNRDFLLEGTFGRATGAAVHPDGVLGRLEGGGRALLLHGDELCTRDLAYQRLRRITRSRLVQGLGPRLPHWISSRVARRLRRASQRALLGKTSEEKALQVEACREAARRLAATTLVCGHAHEPRDEAVGETLRWIVLGAFGEERDALRVGAEGRLELLTSGAERTR